MKIVLSGPIKGICSRPGRDRRCAFNRALESLVVT